MDKSKSHVIWRCKVSEWQQRNAFTAKLSSPVPYCTCSQTRSFNSHYTRVKTLEKNVIKQHVGIYIFLRKPLTSGFGTYLFLSIVSIEFCLMPSYEILKTKQLHFTSISRPVALGQLSHALCVFCGLSSQQNFVTRIFYVLFPLGPKQTSFDPK